MWVLIAVSQLEAKDAVLGKNRIPRNKVFLWPKVHIVQKTVICTSSLIFYHAVPVRKRATLHVLTRDSNMVSLKKESTKGHTFCGCPIDGLTSVNIFLLLLQLSFQAIMKFEAIGYLAQLVPNFRQQFYVNTSRRRMRFTRWACKAFPFG